MARVEDVANRLLESYGLSTAPIDVEDLARRLGARVSREPLDAEVSGLLFRDGPHTVIGVNSSHSRHRQRFTIAHEIGHWQLHKGRQITVDLPGRVNLRDGTSSLATIPEEIDANAFAAELLMPRSTVIREYGTLAASRPSATEGELSRTLAKRFNVSLEAMNYRMTNLGLMSQP